VRAWVSDLMKKQLVIGVCLSDKNEGRPLVEKKGEKVEKKSRKTTLKLRKRLKENLPEVPPIFTKMGN